MGSILGAGGILRVGPAPQIVVLCIVLAQVPTLFPHLRQNAHTPAPTFSTTCANGWYNLNWFHHLTNQVEEEGRLRERDARIRHRRIGAKKAPEAPFLFKSYNLPR